MFGANREAGTPSDCCSESDFALWQPKKKRYRIAVTFVFVKAEGFAGCCLVNKPTEAPETDEPHTSATTRLLKTPKNCPKGKLIISRLILIGH